MSEVPLQLSPISCNKFILFYNERFPVLDETGIYRTETPSAGRRSTARGIRPTAESDFRTETSVGTVKNDNRKFVSGTTAVKADAMVAYRASERGLSKLVSNRLAERY